jgi:hypothetical protein
MRKPAVAPLAVRKIPLRDGNRAEASVQVVCVALALALFALACRIASIW